MQRRGGGTTRTVPVPDHTQLRIGTLQSNIRQSGPPRELFEEQKAKEHAMGNALLKVDAG